MPSPPLGPRAQTDGFGTCHLEIDHGTDQRRAGADIGHESTSHHFIADREDIRKAALYLPAVTSYSG